MKIKKEILDKIFYDFKDKNKEYGGIIGIKDDCIYAYSKDEFGKSSRDSYEPNVDFINSTIDSWYKEGIDFIGIVHNHIGGCAELSDIDIEYFRRIIKNNEMKEFIAILVTNEIFFYRLTLDTTSKLEIEII